MAEVTATSSQVGNPGPRHLVKHKKNAKKRQNLKENFANAKDMDGIDIQELIGEFLSAMGHNVVSSTLIGRNTGRIFFD